MYYSQGSGNPVVDIDIMKLVTVFRTLSVGLFIVILLFSFRLIGNTWSIYQSHVNNTLLLDGFKNGLSALESISAERGYTNTFLGEQLTTINAEKTALAHVRSSTDDAIHAVFPALMRLPTSQRIIAVRNIHLLQQHITENRKIVDTLLTKDKAMRSQAALNNAIQSDIELIAYMDNIIATLANDITKNNVTLLDAMHAIRTTTALRDSAGQLASTLIPAVITGNVMSTETLIRYAQIRQRIGDLHVTLNQQLTTASSLPQSAFWQQKNRLENNYFRQAIRFADSIAATGKTSGDYHITSGQLTDVYGSSTAPIVQLRKILTTSMIEGARTQKQDAWNMLLLHVGFSLFALVFLSIALYTMHKRMIMPILEAAFLLSQPAQHLYKRTPQPMYKTRDEASSMLLTLYAMRTGTHPKTTLPTIRP